MLDSASVILRFSEEVLSTLAQDQGIAYPRNLAGVMKERLEKLVK